MWNETINIWDKVFWWKYFDFIINQNLIRVMVPKVLGMVSRMSSSHPHHNRSQRSLELDRLVFPQICRVRVHQMKNLWMRKILSFHVNWFDLNYWFCKTYSPHSTSYPKSGIQKLWTWMEFPSKIRPRNKVEIFAFSMMITCSILWFL